MRFCYFNPIPWPHLAERPKQWPFPNSHFDPRRAHQLYREQIEQFVFAEECGFDWVAVGEDHMTAYSLTPNPSLILAILAHATKRVKLAVLGYPLPLLNPLRVAEEAAMLDVISGGRLIVGFIRGVPQNYAAYNVDPDESRGRFAEASQLIVKAWTEPGPFAWEGEYYKFPSVSPWPLPLQKPHPPLIYSANSVASAVFAAKQRAMIGAIHLYNRNALDQVREAFAAYRQQARADGWEPGPDRFLIGLQTCIAETDEAAQNLLAPALDYQYKVLSGTYNAQKREIARTKPGYGLSPTEENPPDLAERLDHRIALCGSAGTVASRIAYLHDKLGVGVICMQFQVGNLDVAHVRTGMSLFQERVLPEFGERGRVFVRTRVPSRRRGV